MYSKKIFLAVGIMALFLLSSQYMGSGLATTNSTTVQHDQVFRTLTVTIVNASIYDDRSSTGDGLIYFKINIGNNTYNTPVNDKVNAPPAYNYVVNYTVAQNISLSLSYINIQVEDKGGQLTDVNPNYLGSFNITNLALGSEQGNYSTTGAIGGSADPQASLIVNTTVIQHNFLVPPVITLNTDKNITYTVGTTGNYLNFSLYDDNPANYSISHNNVTLFSGGWKNNAQILFNIDGLGVGVSNYTILAYDIYSAYSVTTIWVNVTAPSGTGTYTGTGSSSNASGRSNRTIGADFAGPQYVLLALAVVSAVLVVRKKRKVS